MSKILIIFEDVKTLKRFLRDNEKLSSNSDIVYFSDNVKAVWRLKKNCGFVFLPEELILEEAEDIEIKAESLAKNFYKTDRRDYGTYNNISLGFVVEYYLTLEISRVLKLVTAIKNLSRTFVFKEVYIVGPGNFCKAVKHILDHENMRYARIRSNFLRKRVHRIRKWKEDGERNKWFGTPFRLFLLEPFFEYLLLIRGTLNSLFHRKNIHGKKLLVLSGNRFTYPVYKRLRDSDITIVVCGHTYPGRKMFFHEKVLNIESFATLSLWREFLCAYHHFWKVWKCAKKDKLLHENLVFNEVKLWPILRNIAKLHLLISMPRLYLICCLADSVFQRNWTPVLLLASDCTPYDRCLVMASQKNAVHSNVVQHGQLIDPCGHNKIVADNIFVWGEATKKWYTNYGNEPEKCTTTGSPKYDDVLKRLSNGFNPEYTRKSLGISSTDKVIAVFTSFADGFCVSSSALQNLHMIESVLQAVSSESDISVVIKPHPGETLRYYKDFCLEMKSKYRKFVFTKDVDLFELLHISDLIISWYSTTIIDAMFLKKPAILVDVANKRSLVPYEERGVVIKVRSKDDMKDSVFRILYDNKQKGKMLKAQEQFLIDYCHIKADMTATDRICKEVTNRYES